MCQRIPLDRTIPEELVKSQQKCQENEFASTRNIHSDPEIVRGMVENPKTSGEGGNHIGTTRCRAVPW